MQRISYHCHLTGILLRGTVVEQQIKLNLFSLLSARPTKPYMHKSRQKERLWYKGGGCNEALGLFILAAYMLHVALHDSDFTCVTSMLKCIATRLTCLWLGGFDRPQLRNRSSDWMITSVSTVLGAPSVPGPGDIPEATFFKNNIWFSPEKCIVIFQ